MKEETRVFFNNMYAEARRFAIAKAEREKEKDRLLEAGDWAPVEAWYEREKQFKNPYTSGQYKAYWAYRRSSENKLDELDMNDSLWEQEVSDFSDTLRAAGVKSFVITNQSTGLMEDIFNLEAQGWQLAGTCKLQITINRYGEEKTEDRLGLRFLDMR